MTVPSPTRPSPAGTSPATGTLSLPAVAGVFARLKLSLLRNGARQSTGRSAAFLATLVLATLFGLLALLGLSVLRGHRNAADVGVTLTAVLALGWASLPMFIGAADETLDPGRLAMLPLRPRQMMTGQLIASVIGPGPLFTLLVLLGIAIGTARGPAGTAAAVLAVPLTLLLCTALSRAIATANARLLSSRRGRDLAVLSGVVVVAALQLFNVAVSRLSENETLAPFEDTAAVLRWLPPATAVEGVRAAGDGAYGTALAALAATALVTLLLVDWWRRGLTRLMTMPDASTFQTAPDGGPARAAGGGLAARLSRGRDGAIMLRALRYAWRDPKSRMGWTLALGMGALMPVILALQGGGNVHSAHWAAALLGLQMYNQFGQDYSGFWLVAQTIGTPADAFAELRGRALGLSLVALPYLLLVTVLAAWLADDWGGLAEAAGISLSVFGAMVASGAVASARFPYSIPEDNAMKNVAPGQGGLAWAGIVAGALCSAVLSAPVIGAAVWLGTSGGALSALVLPLGLGWGLLVAWGGLRVAAPLTAARLPEILTAVSRA
ncbi:transporter [Streptomyces sp. MS19]|uniref:transporter n=1 Tax=Streptomyces sp. MS19 TaxID=3385972 RepID=UPI00399F4A57